MGFLAHEEATTMTSAHPTTETPSRRRWKPLLVFLLILIAGFAAAFGLTKFLGPASPPAPKLAWIPPGEFLMGSGSGPGNERPAHLVRLDGFWMDEAEVTNAEFRRFVEA